ncbi:hypothetical protein ACLB2K_069439 [Fragaria x ananassa]
MAKKKDRRVVAPSSDRRKDRVEPPHQLARSTSFSNRNLAITFFVVFVVSSAVSVLVYRRLSFAPITDRTESYVFRRGLVKPDVNYQEILTENAHVSENATGRHYKYPVLAYITPWNSKGYDLAKRFNSKFTHISPVWYDLKSQGASLILEGRHNADIGWISDLRRAGDAWVLPRVVLEAFPAELLAKKKQRKKAIDLIVSECKEMGYDGIVLESWSRWAVFRVLHDPKMRNMALQFIKDLGDALHAVTSERNNKNRLQLVYVIGPPHSETLQVHDFGPKDLQSLSDAVDGFSLMTYDFSGPHNPGPNAPLKWIESILQLLLGTNKNTALANKILLGINFYGNDFILSEGQGGGAITGRDYLSLLEKHKPDFRWEKNSAEHLFLYTDDDHNNHAVFYPSLLSISMRLEEARKWGCGISIWEIGQVNYAMEALNAASLTPISVLGDRKKEPRKFPSLPSISLPKFSSSTSYSTKASQEGSSKSFHGGLFLLSSVFNAGFAKALTYEEALGQSVSTATGDFDTDKVLDNVISFVNDNPAVIAGGFVLLAVPLVLSQVLKKPKPFGVESAKSAYAKLGEDANALLVDIRAPGEIRQVGSPDIRGLGKKAVPIVYKGEDKPGFLKKLSLKFKEPENTTLFILDKFDGNSELVAELVTVNGFKAAYAIKDGAEGPRGWVSSGLPWIPPPKVLSLDFGNLADAFSGAVGEGSGALSVSLGIAAVTGLGLLAFTEVETILQLLGSAALVQFASKKLLFAEDRNKTLQEVDTFLSTKVAPKELLGDIKQIGIALLPPVTSKSLPAPAEASPAPTAADTVVKAEASPEPKVEAAAEPAPEINSVPKAEVKEESLPVNSRPLSPFPYYPDFKPPTSPRPSQP